MGNIVEPGDMGFGDTRIPSDGNEEDVEPSQNRDCNFDPSQYTYRDGVNYKLSTGRDALSSRIHHHSKSLTFGGLQNGQQSQIPYHIVQAYPETNIVELERIWEAYKSLLVDQAQDALNELSYIDERSNLLRMISIKKLFKEAKMYMSQEEIQAIQRGQLKQYLAQFQDYDEDSQSEIDLDNESQDQSLHSPGRSPRKQDRPSSTPVEERKVIKKYKPDVSPPFILDQEVRRNDCQFACNGPVVDKHEPRSIQFGIVQLEFQDFFRLMQLKIQFQRQSISQTHYMGKLDKARGDYVAAQAYGAKMRRMANPSNPAPDLQDSARMMSSRSRGRFGISKNNSEAQLQNHANEPQSNVVVETNQTNVSCFLWPFFDTGHIDASHANFGNNASIPMVDQYMQSYRCIQNDSELDAHQYNPQPQNGYQLQSSNKQSLLVNQYPQYHNLEKVDELAQEQDMSMVKSDRILNGQMMPNVPDIVIDSPEQMNSASAVSGSKQKNLPSSMQIRQLQEQLNSKRKKLHHSSDSERLDNSPKGDSAAISINELHDNLQPVQLQLGNYPLASNQSEQVDVVYNKRNFMSQSLSPDPDSQNIAQRMHQKSEKLIQSKSRQMQINQLQLPGHGSSEQLREVSHFNRSSLAEEKYYVVSHQQSNININDIHQSKSVSAYEDVNVEIEDNKSMGNLDGAELIVGDIEIAKNV